jgi:uncharacterized protein YjbI with pentapeptide repeats
MKGSFIARIPRLLIAAILFVPRRIGRWVSKQTWIGLGPYTSPDGKTERGKTLWDWMSLLVAPALIAVVVAAYADRLSSQNSYDLQKNSLEETALQDYLDRMNDLLLNEHLAPGDPGSNVAYIAKALTDAVIPELNTERKHIVVAFLSKTGLIIGHNVFPQSLVIPTIDLIRTDLSSVDLSQLDLTGAFLSEANLSQANLNGAFLKGAELSGAILTDASLVNTHMFGADLTDASLVNTHMLGADLRRANLRGANLNGADLRRALLSDKTILDETILPDGSNWTPGTDLTKFGAIVVVTPEATAPS